MKIRIAATAALAALLPLAASAPAQAQAAWDSPMLLAPGAPAGYGIHLIDASPGDGIGVLGTWRANPTPVGLGFRLGIVEGAQSDLALIGGIDVAGDLARTDGEVPVDFMWFAGAGLGIDHNVLLSFPVGIAAGLNLSGDEVQFRPWLAPRIVLDAYLGNGTRDDLDLGLAVEIGLDLQFSQPWAIRASGSFGDREAVSIGLVFPGDLTLN